MNKSDAGLLLGRVCRTTEGCQDKRKNAMIPSLSKYMPASFCKKAMKRHITEHFVIFCLSGIFAD